MDSLKQLYSTAASMQYFTPSQGYGYYPPSAKPSTKPIESLRNSRSATPLLDTSQSQSQIQLQTPISKTAQPRDLRETNALAESLNLSMRYNSEYMNTNPLVGEPGSFVFSSTQGHLQAQKNATKAQAATLVTKASQESRSTNASSAPTPMPELKTSQTRKGSKIEKEKTPTSAGPGSKPKRRKSRVPASPEGEV
jgi:mediator of RNA polymerase II transcription subunit 6